MAGDSADLLNYSRIEGKQGYLQKKMRKSMTQDNRTDGKVTILLKCPHFSALFVGNNVRSLFGGNSNYMFRTAHGRKPANNGLRIMFVNPGLYTAMKSTAKSKNTTRLINKTNLVSSSHSVCCQMDIGDN